jgi:hypothetical protein
MGFGAGAHPNVRRLSRKRHRTIPVKLRGSSIRFSSAREYVPHVVAKVGINPAFGLGLTDTVQLSGRLDRPS